jgi:hypothetical protein
MDERNLKEGDWNDWYIVKDRPVLSSERAPHINKPAIV